MNRLQKDLINLRIALSASRLNCQKFFFSDGNTFFLVNLIEIFILKRTMYHKYTLTYQKYKKSKKKRYYRLCSKCAKH
jgi:hypothetical protein